MTMLLSLIVTAVATAASFLGTEPMLRAMNTPENIFSDSAAYIGIIFLGLGASLFYNLFSGLLRAVGDSKTPLYFLCLSSALNVVLDLLFVVTSVSYTHLDVYKRQASYLGEEGQQDFSASIWNTDMQAYGTDAIRRHLDLDVLSYYEMCIRDRNTAGCSCCRCCPAG